MTAPHTSDSDPTPRHSLLHRRAIGPALGLTLLLALVWRLDGFRDDLWIDELHTAWVVDGDWNELPERAAIGNQSPLYFILLKCVRETFGLTEAALRGPSLLAGMALVLAGGWFTWRKTGEAWCAWLSLVALGFEQNCIYYSSEARPYALMQLVLAGHVALAIDSRQGMRSAFARASLAAIGIHLQFTAILFLFTLYLGRLACSLWKARTKRWEALARLGLELLVVALLVAPLASQMLEIASRGQDWSAVIPAPSWIGLWRLFPWTPALIGLTAFGLSKPRLESSSSRIGWLAWASLAPAALAALIALVGGPPLFFRRYLLACAWPLQVLPGICVAKNRGADKVVFLFAIFAAAIGQNQIVSAAVWRSGRLTARRGEDWRSAAEKIRQLDPDGKLPLYVNAGLIESRRLDSDPSPLLRDYCRLPIATLYQVPHAAEKRIAISSVVPEAPPAGWIAEIERNRGGLWVIRLGSAAKATGKWRALLNRLRGELASRDREAGWRLEEMSFAGVTVFELQR